jgi:hypothetical protein
MLKTFRVGGQLYVQFPARKKLEQPAMGGIRLRAFSEIAPLAEFVLRFQPTSYSWFA